MSEKSIQGLVDDWIAEGEKKERKSSGKFSPSLLGACYRRQIWKRRGEPQTNPPDARALRVFRAGDLFHDFVQNLIPKDKIEVMVENDNFLGFADVVQEDAVLDIKSQHSKGFWYMDKPSYDVNVEKRNNILQVVFYAWMLGKKWAKLCFVSKDDLCIKEYGFSVEKWQGELEGEVATLVSYWGNNELPDAEPRLYGGKECQWCQFKTKCESVGGKVWSEPKEKSSTSKRVRNVKTK